MVRRDSARRCRPSRSAAASLAATALLAGTLIGCGADDDSGRGGTESGTVRVFAAASLTEAFSALASRFEREHAGIDIAFNFFSSSVLAQQILAGAPADVYASADREPMQELVAAGLVTDPVPIARNRLAILVERGNPKEIRRLADLDRDGVTFVVCASAAPCGRLAAVALDRARVTARPRSLEDNVKAVVSRVVLGEADAGIVYATDVAAAGGRAEGVDIGLPGDSGLEAEYLVAVTADTGRPRAGAAWVELVTSPAGQRVLRRLGFLPP